MAWHPLWLSLVPFHRIDSSLKAVNQRRQKQRSEIHRHAQRGPTIFIYNIGIMKNWLGCLMNARCTLRRRLNNNKSKDALLHNAKCAHALSPPCPVRARGGVKILYLLSLCCLFKYGAREDFLASPSLSPRSSSQIYATHTLSVYDESSWCMHRY